ncbi:MAG: phosphatase PAP2 family protein [Vicingaceae bacterium]
MDRIFMRIYLLIGLVLVLFNQQCIAQSDTTLKVQKKILPQLIVPAVFIASGIAVNNSISEKGWQTTIRNKVGNNYHNGIDDYIQYVPFVQVYLGDAIGIKAKNHWFDQTKNIFLGGMVTLIVTHAIKRGVGKERPDLSSNHSFSSGHTASAFLGGTILYHEYKDDNMLYASSGYLFSATAGSFRVINNRHWVSDVLAGAGIGILVGNLIYHIEPLKNWNPFKNTKNITFSPVIGNDKFTFTAGLTF